MFLCNHCPYVRHVERRLGEVVADYAARDLAAVAVNSNDLDAYPEDGPAGMAGQARRAGFGFPYLVDEGQQVAADYRAMCTPDLFVYDADRRLAYRGAFDDSQQVAAAYRAMCTPDLFVYDAERRLAYRGAFDDSTPRNGQPVTGALLRDALDRVLAGQPVPEPHRPSMGCSLKWREGNRPSWLLGSG
jgi:thiol-disulfide isomerase/thioredoxin